MAHFHHVSICNQNQSISILVMSGQNTKAIALRFGQNSLIFITLSICNQNQSISILVIFGQNTTAIALLFWPKIGHFHHFSICNQNQSISILVMSGQNTTAIALLFWPNTRLIFITLSICNQNQSISILVIFVQNTTAIALLFGRKLAHFHHVSICNQNQSISFLVNFGQNTKAIALLFGQKWLIFITFQSAIKINQFQFWSFLAKLPRLQPYCLAKHRSFSSLVNLQSKSINFNFGHFCPKYQGYSLTFWPKHGSFSSLFNLQSKSINFIFGHFWTKYQGYSLTFWPKIAHFHHFSICNQNQSISILVIFGQNTKAIALLFGQKWLISSLFNLQSKSINFNFGHFWPKYQGYSLTFWPKMAHCHHFSICNQNQSISILVIFGQNTKAIALLFGQTWLIFITFQSAIKINQFQFWSFLAKIPRLQPYCLAKTGSFSSLVNLQSKSINFNFGHFWPKHQGYSLTFWPKIAHFHHFSICNQNQSISILVIFGQNTKAIALRFGRKWLIFITFQSAIKINQFQFWSCLDKIPRLQPYFLAKTGSFSSRFNLQSKSINFNFGHFWPKHHGYSLTVWPKLADFHHVSICNQNQSISILVIFGQNTTAIALLFGQKSLIFITCQSAIKINQFQFWSFLAKIPRLQPYFLAKHGSFSSLFNLQSKSINFNFGHFWTKYQGYSLTFWPKIAHFHHFSICNQNQSISILVIFGQNTKAIALLFGQKWLIFITFQSAIKINQFQFWSFLAKIPRLQPYFLAKNAHCHHFSICNQNQSISILVIFGQNTKAIALLFGQTWLIFITFQSAIKINQFQFWSFLAKIPRLQPYCLAKTGSFSSLVNLQSKSINFNFGHFWPKHQGYSLTFWPKIAHFHHFSICNQNQSISILVIFGQNTKAIALRFGRKWLIFITFQSAIKINQFQFWSCLDKIPRLQPYFLAKTGSFSSRFNLQSKSINFNFGHFWPKHHGYSLTVWPKLADFHHVSICNQNQSISILVIFGQNTTAIALLFGQKSLIFITCQSAIKINQFQFWSFLSKIPRLQPYFLAENGSFSSLFNLQSKSINFIFGHFWPNYQGYSLTFWPKMPHFHHFSFCNQTQSISMLVIFGQNTKAIALLFGRQWLIVITFQSAIKINQFQFWSFLAKIPRLQPYLLAKHGSFSSLFNLQSKSINFNFGHFWTKYQGYSLTFWPKMAHFHHFQSAIKINQFQFWSFLAKIPRLQPYFLAKNGSFSSLFNLESKSINFNFGHFWPNYQGYSLTVWPNMAHFHHVSICNQNESISILVIFGQNTKAIALRFGQKSLIFITCQSAIKINQFQFWSILAKIPRLQPYFWPKMAHFHHFSICNQNQSISILVMSGQNTKAIALLFGQNWLIFITCSICNQNQSISILVIFGQNTTAIALLFGQNWLIFITFQSAIKINQFQFWSFLAKNYHGYSLTVWPKIAHFHHVVNLQSKSINFKFGHFWPKYQGYSLTLLAEIGSFSSLFNLQSKSINFIFGHCLAKLPRLQPYFLAENWLIFITFHSAIKLNQFQCWSFLAKIPRLQPYCLADNWLMFITCQSAIKINQFQFWSFLAKTTKAIALLFGQNWLIVITLSICNQNQSISILVIFGQNTKAIALLFGQKWLIFITCQSAIKINQFQFWSFLDKIPRLQAYFLAKNGSFSSLFNLQSKSINFNFGHCLAKIPRLQPYFLAKNRSFSSLFNLQSKSINFNFGHFWPKYQGYSLTFWSKMAHFHHFSICNQNQSISILVIFGQTTKAIALLFGQKQLIFITFQSAIKINQF